MEQIKILFSTDSLLPGGKERQLCLLFAGLSDKYSISILSKPLRSDSHYLDEYGIKENHIFYYTCLRDYKNCITRLKPSIVLSWDGLTSIYNLLLCYKQKFIFLNGSIRHGIRLLRFSHLLRSFICLLSPYVIANSYAGLKANNLKPSKKRFILYNGIEDKFKNNFTKNEIENKRRLLIPGYSKRPGIVFISVANMVPYKDYFTVIKALGKLKKTRQFYYYIVGDGSMKQDVENAIIETKLQDRIFLTGKIENVSDYLFISDIMIHSSRGEGISNAILEGMYAGLPVIATNVGGIPETLFPKSSLLFPYKDDKALLDCLVKAPEAFNKFDPQSKEYKDHLEKFSVENMVNRFHEIIGKVIEEAEDVRL